MSLFFKNKILILLFSVVMIFIMSLFFFFFGGGGVKDNCTFCWGEDSFHSESVSSKGGLFGRGGGVVHCCLLSLTCVASWSFDMIWVWLNKKQCGDRKKLLILHNLG